jgi:hypothetical protein
VPVTAAGGCGGGAVPRGAGGRAAGAGRGGRAPAKGGRAGRRRPAGRRSPHGAPAKDGRRSRASGEASAGAEVAARGAGEGRARRRQAWVGPAGEATGSAGALSRSEMGAAGSECVPDRTRGLSLVCLVT